MKTGKTFKVCGSVIKKESLVYIASGILENTTIAEANQPYANYYGQIPLKPQPNSLFLLTDNEYTLEEALRFTQNIDICAKNQVNAASAIIYTYKTRIPAIRIRNFPDYQHLRMLQECYMVQGVKFIKKKIPEKEPVIKVHKCFSLESAGNGFFFDRDEENEGYFSIPFFPDLESFNVLLQNIRNNSSCSLFDAACGGFIIDGKVIDMIRIYSGHMNLDLLKCIRNEAIKWMDVKPKVRPLQEV